MDERFYCLEYQIDEQGFTEYGVLGRTIYRTKGEAEKEMVESYEAIRERLMDEYELEDIEDSVESDHCSFSGDDRVSLTIEIVEVEVK